MNLPSNSPLCECGGLGNVVQHLLLVIPLLFFDHANAVALSGSPKSFARYPKWSHTFENQFSFDFRTRQTNALLLYMDDGGVNGNFFVLTIADSRLQLDFRLGDDTNENAQQRAIVTLRVDDVAVSDYRWHRFQLFQAWENVKIQLDDTVLFKILAQRSFVFGDLRTNSDVYIGGVPNNVQIVSNMSSPLRRYAKRFAGTVRNLLYRLYPQGVTSPPLLDGVGVRDTEDDFCRTTSKTAAPFCQNQGRCYSTNEGPKCDCSLVDFEGRRCDRAKPSSELFLSGHELLGYDLTNSTGALVRSRSENFTLVFKTTNDKALLFIAGGEMNYLHLTLDDGAILATSHFYGMEKRLLKITSNGKFGRFDDNKWHAVSLYRNMKMRPGATATVHMILEVDHQKDEIRQYAPETDWFPNSYLYVGGVPKIKAFEQIEAARYKGCLKHFRYEAESLLFDLANVVESGFDQNLIKAEGDVATSCQNPSMHPDILSFNKGNSFLTLPKWNSMATGVITFQFRTTEPNGLLLFHGDPASTYSNADYVAIELIDGHLYLVLNLGSGATTASPLTEGTVWHRITLERRGRSGSVTVDDVKTDFSTPGSSANLNIEDSIYIGGIDWSVHNRTFPSDIWSIGLGTGFIGCLKSLRINSISAQLAVAYDQQKQRFVNASVELGCANVLKNDQCASSPCANNGRCLIGYLSFKCDCSNTIMDGERCDIEPHIISLNGSTKTEPFTLTRQHSSEAEDLEMKLRTSSDHAVILDSQSDINERHQFKLSVVQGELQLLLNVNDTPTTYHWGTNINDGRWHSIKIRRRGEKLLLYIDGKWERIFYMPAGNTVITMNRIQIGYAKPSDKDDRNDASNTRFKGDLVKLTFNGQDLLQTIRQKVPRTAAVEETTDSATISKTRASMISFDTDKGYALFTAAKLNNAHRSPSKIAMKFRTLSPSAVMLVAFVNLTIASREEWMVLELTAGKVRFSVVSGKQMDSVTTPTVTGAEFDDLRWHSLLVYQNEETGDHHLLVDNQTVILNRSHGKYHHTRIRGPVYLGGLPPGSPFANRLGHAPGFRGCIAALKIGDAELDVFEDAEETVQVKRGCASPASRCTKHACKNHGRCMQTWNSFKCDCTWTTYSGDACDSPGTTYLFETSPAAIYYEYPAALRPSTGHDRLALGFQTRMSTGVLLSVQCSVDGDFLTVYLNDGYVQVKYNLGANDHHIGYFDVLVNDGHYHHLRFERRDANATFALDEHIPIVYMPPASGQLFTLNAQWRISLGASFGQYHTNPQYGVLLQRRRRLRRSSIRIFDAYQGRISGVNYNGIMILDLYAQGSKFVHAIGAVRLAHQAAISTLLTTPAMTHSYETAASGSRLATTPYSTEESNEGGLLEREQAGCLPLDFHDKCLLDEDDASDLISPVISTSVLSSAPPRSRSPTTTVGLPVVLPGEPHRHQPEGDDNEVIDGSGLFVSSHPHLHLSPSSQHKTSVRPHHHHHPSTTTTTPRPVLFPVSRATIAHSTTPASIQRSTPTPTTTQWWSRPRTTFSYVQPFTARPRPFVSTTTIETITTAEPLENVQPFVRLRYTSAFPATPTPPRATREFVRQDFDGMTPSKPHWAFARPVVTTSSSLPESAQTTIIRPLPYPYITTTTSTMQPPSKSTSTAPTTTSDWRQKPTPTKLPRPYVDAATAVDYDAQYFENLWQDVEPPFPTYLLTTKYVTKPTSTTTTSTTTSTTTTTTERTTTATLTTTKSTSTPVLRIHSASTSTSSTGRSRTTSTPSVISSLATTPRTWGTASSLVFAVRPTTPMGETMTTTTIKSASAFDSFPKTDVILIASGALITVIAFVLLWVFCKCRSRPGPGDAAYPMVCNGKQGGYAPIPATPVTPAMGIRTDHGSEAYPQPPDEMEDASMPFLQTRVGQLNGYQPLKGAVIPNGNGQNGMKNGARKKEFKEWYV